MQWSEQAIVLSAKKFGESGLLVEVFARGKGLYSGMVRGGQSKSKANIYQSGNIIDATWYGRLEEQLGTFSGELTNAVASKVIHDQLRLLALISLTSILRKTLIDRHPYDDLYEHYVDFFTGALHEENWLTEYVWMEIALLRYLGFGLDLSCCAVTGRTDGLAYISPRTGRAVTVEGAKGYEERLFRMPDMFSPSPNPLPRGEGFTSPLPSGWDGEGSDVLAALEISEYFISQNLFSPHDRQLPSERGRFVSGLKKHLQNRTKAGIYALNHG